ncbi:glutathione S-transferase family protein [Falsiroseomonas sp.]|uniref:glutathione S-transferase family protein n=1 Tax=Falsiroseomonas sp. TaxID=2870721 RepID=UPI00356AFED2
MPLTLHYLSGSPYTWRVHMALAHKRIPHVLRPMSYDAGDFRSPDFAALNPRRRVPVITEDDFTLYESAAILEYLEDIAPDPPLLAADPRRRAIQRRMVREADQYVATHLEHLVESVLFTPPDQRDPHAIAAAQSCLRAELALWETLIEGEFLAGTLSAADLTLFPLIALARRIAARNPGLVEGELTGPRLADWMARMEALPLVRATWPPHWGPPPGT